MALVDEYLDSPMESVDDDNCDCKGCGRILEEGKAFELAGNRWHIDCFRCHNCGTLLDSDANLLLLGDGSLICNNCTYSCSACGNKIEDLAILTGEQAFCASCFRCKNCRRKIENLRYARTSQGIYCMSCHESVMARRKKKSRTPTSAKSREKDASPMITDKSLPALPPNAIPPNAFSSDRVAPESDTPTELSPRPRPAYGRNDSSSRNSSRAAHSPERGPDAQPREGGLALPQSSYRNNRNSTILLGSDGAGGDGDGFFIPVALDHSPVPAAATPRSASDAIQEPRKLQKDYFKANNAEKGIESQGSTPHIAFQEKGRQTSSDYESPSSKPPQRKLSKASRQEKSQHKTSGSFAEDATSAPPDGAFKLQDVPRNKKLGGSRAGSRSDVPVTEPGSMARESNGNGRKELLSIERSDSGGSLNDDKSITPRTSADHRRPSADQTTQASRSDSGGAKTILRKELPGNTGRSVNGKQTSGQLGRSNTADDVSASPAPLSTRPPAAEHKVSDTYMQPRAPPQPPQGPNHTHGKESISGMNGAIPEPKGSPKLPRWSATGEFSMDEDMARILGTDEGSSSIMRRVSNAVRHGRTNSTESGTTQMRTSHTRSVSETTRATNSPHWPKTPIIENPDGPTGHNISSPIGMGSAADDPAFLKRQLRNSEQRVAELERRFTTEGDLKNLSKKVLEKKKTVSVLDTQTEIMIRQLEVLAGYVERAKEMSQPIDPQELEESAIKDFVQKLEKVKQDMAASIEQLHAERSELLDERNRAMADRDRAILEFEQLSSKNAQLVDMNNDLTHQIQGRFKAQAADPRSPSGSNGLGIYGTNKVPTPSGDAISIGTGTTSTYVDVGDDSVVESGPTVVNLRKGGQVKKFVQWKKSSKAVAQNVAKGVKGAYTALQQPQDRERGERTGHPQLTGDNIGLPYNMTTVSMDSPILVGPGHIGFNGQQQQQQGQRHPSESQRQGFGFFKKNTLPKSMSLANMSTPTIAESPSTLFGSDLTERADFERRHIPNVVTRCIEEVELRGMDVEGIYRKTGGNREVTTLQEAFDRNENLDSLESRFDITAVTSVLKQYLRKLPNPLLTFEVYDLILEANKIANEAERCVHLREVFAKLPPRHRDTLEFLMFHLSRVAQRERENLMSPKNLAVVFAPTIMRAVDIEREMTDTVAKNLAVQFIVENSHVIFAEA